MKIVIGSKNPAKIKAVEEVFEKYKPEIIALSVPSGVSEQPLSDEETMKGAMNRAWAALEAGQGDIGIGLEGGVQQHENGLFLCNWGVLAEEGKPPLFGGGARIPLPEEISSKLLAGEELGPVMEDFAKKENVRKQEGAVGIFTNQWVNRSEMFSHIVKLLIGQFEYRNARKS
ncbi:DUF84 family protein [Bacillus dakarensis]|uniref:DUF84 family protein n=1 Tax=Robertmurraya dakarensis TaxID=1926278 RepID=UPI0009816439|nr:DUF84 family protein [Bacillus dakarensis]